jgi:hypothetical protein
MAARHPNPDAKNGGTHVAPQPLHLAFGRFAAPELLSRKGQPGVGTTSFDARKGPFFFWYAGQNAIRPSRIPRAPRQWIALLVFRGLKNRTFLPQLPGTDLQRPEK